MSDSKEKGIENENKTFNAWDSVDPAFNTWWDRGYDGKTNPYTLDSPAYWAWAGWVAAKTPLQ